MRKLMREDNNNQVNLDKIIYNIASAKHATTNSDGNNIVAPNYWKQLYALGENKDGLMQLALNIFGCPGL
ncbi:hypothetical protein JCM1841_005384 [Sporobolomyces salmonicolor]